MSLSTERVAYFAGLFDGEGCISFYRAGGNWYPCVSIAMTDPGPVAAARESWGGTISRRKGSERQMGIFQWRVFGQKAAAFLDDVGPYLITKHDQAANVLPWLQVSTRRGRFRGPCIPIEEQETIRARHYDLRFSRAYRSVPA